VHRDFPSQATAKANDLVRMAVAKVRLVEPLQRKELEFNHDALVIGGGLAGMTAAQELAGQGFQVSLVEKERELGGNMRHLQYLLSLADPQGLLRNLIVRTMNNPNIHLFLDAEVATFEGTLGNFKSTIKLSSNDSTPIINHGVAIVATGAVPYQPTEYHYGEDDRVLTQLELEQILVNEEPEAREWDSVVMIQCVGSRNAERPYCSRLCCSQAVKNALVVKEKSPETEVYILYRDIRTYGLLEKFYRKAREKGVVFIRFEDDSEPKVSIAKDNGARGKLAISVHDAMLDDRVDLRADRVVLSVATVPNPDAGNLAQLLKVPLTQDGFFQEAHLKLAPVDFATEGIFLCGMAHYPKKAVTETVIQAKAAAGRAATILSKPVIEISPTISHVVEDKCDGCAYCVDPCPYNAITLVEYENEAGQLKKRVIVDEAICKGCGTCQATCPKDAIYVSHFRLDQLRAMTMAALEM
jgi:heterodisulfide reductase subunit A